MTSGAAVPVLCALAAPVVAFDSRQRVSALLWESVGVFSGRRAERQRARSSCLAAAGVGRGWVMCVPYRRSRTTTHRAPNASEMSPWSAHE